MCDRIDAVREVRRRAQLLTDACAVIGLCQAFDPVVAEPVPAEMTATLAQLNNVAVFAPRRR